MENLEYIEIEKVHPAIYNPRQISDDSFTALQESIKEIGFVLPILINRKNNTIIAGHQRTKAATAIGAKTVPCFFVDGITDGDEIRFNQMHNGVDLHQKSYPKMLGELTTGFQQIDPNIINDYPELLGNQVKEICRLILKYGNVLCALACGNEILMHIAYIKACKLLNIKANINFLPKEMKEKVIFYFGKDYGEYSYNNIKRETFVQGLAQMYRLNKEGSRHNKSKLYETCVLPYIKDKKEIKILDFGCGKGAYIERVSKQFKAVGVEFFNNNGTQINITKGNQQIDNLLKFLIENGLFDYVVCDSVLNSVDSVKAEQSVISVLNMFCKDILFVSGRSYDFIKRVESQSKSSDLQNYIHFLDKDKYTGNYRKGHWYFQHFHNRQDIEKLLEEYGFQILKLQYEKNDSSWQCIARKVKDLSKEQYIAGVDFEFNLPLPNGKTYNRHIEVKQVLKQIGVL